MSSTYLNAGAARAAEGTATVTHHRALNKIGVNAPNILVFYLSVGAPWMDPELRILSFKQQILIGT